MIKLTKIKVNADSTIEQAKTIEEYRASLERGEDKSPPVEYTINGIPMNTPTIGQIFIVDRHSRNGVEVRGIFNTSTIIDIIPSPDVTFILTQNSVYKLENIS